MACLSPVWLKEQQITVSCMKCPPCKSKRISEWWFRLNQELKIATHSQFITLTYDERNVPLTRSGRPTLLKGDLQNFFKKLRKRANGSAFSNIRYYSVGEYGGETQRPHYHAILFNADIKTIQLSWEKGMVHYDPVNDATIRYTLNYLDKPRMTRKQLFGREPEFNTQSKGLGKNYLASGNMAKWHKADFSERVHIPLEDGVIMAMPRYYRLKIYTKQEQEALTTILLQKGQEAALKRDLAIAEEFGYENVSAKKDEIRREAYRIQAKKFKNRKKL